MARPKLGRSTSGKKANARPRNPPNQSQQASSSRRVSPPVESLSYPPAPAPDEGLDDGVASLAPSDNRRHDSTATGTGQWSVFQNQMNEETISIPENQHQHAFHNGNADPYDSSNPSLRRFDSPPASVRSSSASSLNPNGNQRLQQSPMYGADSVYGSESTLVPDNASSLQYGDSASNYYTDNEKLGPVGNSASFLAVPEMRHRQGASVMAGGPGAFVGGFDPTERFSSVGSVASSDREATSEAWVKRQKIKPGRAKTKKVKLTKGRFIAEFGEFGHMHKTATK